MKELLRSPAFRRYAFGLTCTFAGAGLTDATGSMWPLALGSAITVMATAQWVQDVRRRAAQRRSGR